MINSCSILIMRLVIYRSHAEDYERAKISTWKNDVYMLARKPGVVSKKSVSASSLDRKAVFESRLRLDPKTSFSVSTRCRNLLFLASAVRG